MIRSGSDTGPTCSIMLIRIVVLAFTATVGLVLTAPAAAGISEASRFLRLLCDRPSVTRADCVAATAVLLEGRHALGPQSNAPALLLGRGILVAEDLADTEREATRGFASILFLKGMGQKGGLVMRLVGRSQYLAYRHMVSLGIAPGGGSGGRITGPELVAMITLARKHMHRARGDHTGEKP